MVEETSLVLEKLSQQVQRLAGRLEDLQEQLDDVSTEVRLQVRRSSCMAAPAAVPPLALLGSAGEGLSCGSSTSVAGPAAASPRVAGPVSAATTPRSSRCGRPSQGQGLSLPLPADIQQDGASTPRTSTLAAAAKIAHSSPRSVSRPSSMAVTVGPAAMTTSGGRAGAAAAVATAAAAAAAAASSPRGDAVATTGCSAAAPQEPLLGGVFGAMKSWGDGALDHQAELQQAMQTATAAAAAAAEAQAAAAKCQQQVLELRGRQGQAERRLDTLWQLQETGCQNQAALAALQGEVQQVQQAQQQQQENVAVARAQALQADTSCSATSSQCAQLQAEVQQLAQQLQRCRGDVGRQGDQLAAASQQLNACVDACRADLLGALQGVQPQAQHQEAQLASCAAAAASGLGKCEDLRQGAVVLAGRLDAVPALIRAAVDPLDARLLQLASLSAAMTRAAGLVESAVQQGQLAAALAQLSTAAARRSHELAQQLAGVASRLEGLESRAALRDQVVLQADLERGLSQLQSAVAADVQASAQQLQAQLQSKADAAGTARTTSHLAERLSSSEGSLLLGLRSLRDRMALLLDGKADAGALREWQQGVTEGLAALKADAARAGQVLQRLPGAPLAAPSPGWAAAEPRPARCGGDQRRCAEAGAGLGRQQQQQQQHAAAAGEVADFSSRERPLQGDQHLSLQDCIAAAEAALSAPGLQLQQHSVGTPQRPAGAAGTAATGADADSADGPNVADSAALQGSSDGADAAPGAHGLAHGQHKLAPPAAAAAAAPLPGALCGAGAMQRRAGRQHSQRSQQAAAPSRPSSSLQPWTAPSSPPSHLAGGLHSAATNAKLVQGAQQRLASQQRLQRRQQPVLPASCAGAQRPAHNSNSKDGPASG